MSSSLTLLPLPAVEQRTGYKKSKLYALIDEGRFPKPVRLGYKAVRFVEAEIDAWIAARIAERDEALAAGNPALLNTRQIAEATGRSESFFAKDRKAQSPRIPVIWRGAVARYDQQAVLVALEKQR